MKNNTNKLVLNLLGLLLLTATVMKGWQLLTEPVANKDIFSNRVFLIFTVEFELALGIWLISGLFKKAAWLSALLCFGLFSAITFYKAITGADSCGCFGSVKINPWITLLTIDLPAVIALAIFHPSRPLCNPLSFLRRQESTAAFLKNFLAPLPSIPHFIIITFIGFAIIAITTPILILNKPAKETNDYVVLEPQTWTGKELPILNNINISNQINKGDWIIVFYHNGCPPCEYEIPRYNDLAQDFLAKNISVKIAVIECPPHEKNSFGDFLPFCTKGKLLIQGKKMIIRTPLAIICSDGIVQYKTQGITKF